MRNKRHPIQSICKMVGVGKTTLYKYINRKYILYS
ncbi:helix-turn-helix domain-containing protein [Legionella saoudiensis]